MVKLEEEPICLKHYQYSLKHPERISSLDN